jgi:hypothetical protein
VRRAYSTVGERFARWNGVARGVRSAILFDIVIDDCYRAE